MAGFLVKTPYVLLLSVTGINVVSAGRLAGEAGPIEHYASARALLHLLDVVARFQQVGREAVTKRVRRDLLRQS
jgi:transposase